jgi:hypothetical protein
LKEGAKGRYVTKTKTETERQANPASPSAKPAAPAAPMPQQGESAAEKQARLESAWKARGPRPLSEESAKRGFNRGKFGYSEREFERDKKALQDGIGHDRYGGVGHDGGRGGATRPRHGEGLSAARRRVPKGPASEDPKDAWPWWKPKDERAHREDLKADARDAAAGRLVAFRAHTEAYSTVPTGFFEQWQKDSAAGKPLPTTAPDVVARVKKTFLAAHYCKLPGDLPTSLRQRRITTGLPINDHRALIKRGETAINSLIDVFNKLSNEESLQLQRDLMDRKETNPDVWTALDATDPRHYVRYRMASLLEKDVYKEVRARTDGKFTGKREDRGDTLTRYARTFSEIKQELAWRCEHIKGQSGRPQDVTLDEWAAMLRKLGLGDGLSAVALRTLGFSVNEDPEAARSSVRQRRKMRK